MEVQVLRVEGVSDDSLISIKAGSSRRQALVSQLGPASPSFSFPTSENSTTFRIDVLKNLGSQRIALRAEDGTYDVQVGENGDANVQLGISGAVCKKFVHSPEKQEIKDPRSPDAGQAQNKEYLENEGVLSLMKSLLATVVLEQPDDPFSFMAEQFSKATFVAGEFKRQAAPVAEASAPGQEQEKLQGGPPPAKELVEGGPPPLPPRATREMKEEDPETEYGKAIALRAVVVPASTIDGASDIQDKRAPSDGTVPSQKHTDSAQTLNDRACDVLKEAATDGSLPQTLNEISPMDVAAHQDSALTLNDKACDVLKEAATDGSLPQTLNEISSMDAAAHQEEQQLDAPSAGSMVERPYIRAGLSKIAQLSVSGQMPSTMENSTSADSMVEKPDIRAGLSKIAQLSVSGQLPSAMENSSHSPSRVANSRRLRHVPGSKALLTEPTLEQSSSAGKSDDTPLRYTRSFEHLPSSTIRFLRHPPTPFTPGAEPTQLPVVKRTTSRYRTAVCAPDGLQTLNDRACDSLKDAATDGSLPQALCEISPLDAGAQQELLGEVPSVTEGANLSSRQKRHRGDFRRMNCHAFYDIYKMFTHQEEVTCKALASIGQHFFTEAAPSLKDQAPELLRQKSTQEVQDEFLAALGQEIRQDDELMKELRQEPPQSSNEDSRPEPSLTLTVPEVTNATSELSPIAAQQSDAITQLLSHKAPHVRNAVREALLSAGFDATLLPADDTRSELRKLKQGELQRRARAVGVSCDEIDNVADEDDPKAALIELIIARESQIQEPGDPSEREENLQVSQASTQGPGEVKEVRAEATETGNASEDALATKKSAISAAADGVHHLMDSVHMPHMPHLSVSNLHMPRMPFSGRSNKSK
jgi:hypothetical protein